MAPAAMQTFRCTCGARIFFENTRCLRCEHELGFLPDVLTLIPLEPNGTGESQTPHGAFRKCSNYVDHGVCNWMVPSGAANNALCQACQLNHVIPDLSQPANRALWSEVEKSKRRLLYTLERLKLPLQSKQQDPEHGLAFDIMADAGSTRVLTGHDDGLITLNLAEADPAEREKMRLAMKEGYRTMLGHFRHEIGHYYWDRLVRGTSNIARFRELFGDETVNYAESLQRHYATKRSDFAESFISAYAAAHPWEDFAETFAHYLHIEDTLETAHDFGISFPANSATGKAPEITEFDLRMGQWAHLTVALNALNRSMGLLDAYPFAISPVVNAKIEFVHLLITNR